MWKGGTMKRQTIALLTLGSFIVFSFSCYSVQPIKPEMLSSPDASELKIRKLDKTSGESIEFAKSNPGRVIGDFVMGTRALTTAVEFVEIARDDLSKISRIPSPQGETFYSVKTRDGKSYRWVKKIVEQEDKSVLYVMKDVYQKATSNFNVSVEDVERVWIKKIDIITTAIVVVACMAAGWYLMIAYAIGHSHWYIR
jgi:predicted RNA-binding protein YlqC (UPF0109 family)